MGSPIDSFGTGDMVLPLLTDHPLLAVVSAEVRLFTSGLIIQRFNNVPCQPVLISIANHVEAVWTVDSETCWTLASTQLPSAGEGHNILKWTKDTTITEGIFVILQLKDKNSMTSDLQSEEDKEDNKKSDAYINPLESSLPGLVSGSCRLVCLFVAEGGREASEVTRVLSDWRLAFRVNDIPEHRGSQDKPLPNEFLRSYLCAIDNWGLQKDVTVSWTGGIDKWSSLSSEVSPETIVETAIAPHSAATGLGYHALR